MDSNRSKRNLYGDMQIRILAETEQYINHCLQHPLAAPRIPRIRSDSKINFDEDFANAFWRRVLSDES